MPRSGEFSDLIHAGWEKGTNNWLWSSEAVYWNSGNYGYSSFRWLGNGTEHWDISHATMAVQASHSELPYRCIWREEFTAEPVRCAPQEIQILSTINMFDCVAAIDGSSGERAHPVEVTDGWGNAWDSLERNATDYFSAATICNAIGARLPTATELYRVRANQNIDVNIGTSESWLWTIVPSHQSERNVTIRISDGDTSSEDMSRLVAYRCIWPTTLGDVFGGRSCYAHPDESCQQSGSLRWDRYDRPALSAPSAAWECTYYGGVLPNQCEMARLIRSGAENGTGNWLWLNRPMYWYRGGYGYAVAQWTDPGSDVDSWVYAPGSGGISGEGVLRNFRCVFSD